MHQYARYFERFRTMAASRPISELCPAEVAAQFKTAIEAQTGQNPEADGERELRARIDTYHLDIFNRCQAETTKRWTYEQEVKRPYFHVTELDDAQLVNWRKYLDFEESEGDYKRITFLYERCVVAAAYYDEFWLRYVRWMAAQANKVEEVRHIYQRAACIYVPVARPEIRLQYALFEEVNGRVEVAHAIYEAILITLPGNVEVISSWASSARRQGGLDAAVEIFSTQIASDSTDATTKASLTAELARLLWKVKGSPDEARGVFASAQDGHVGNNVFWTRYLEFEIEQPANAESDSTQFERIKELYQRIRSKGQLQTDALKQISHTYMVYLLDRGTKDAAKEFLTIDREING